MWPTTDMRAMPMVAFAAVVAASVALVVTLDPSEPTDDAKDTAARAKAGSSISYIGGTPRGTDCSGQTWPYIERRCLVDAPPRVAADNPPPMQADGKGARNAAAAAPDVAASAATDGSGDDTTASVPASRDATPRGVSVERGESRPTPTIAMKSEKRLRRPARQEHRSVSDEELAAAIEQDIARSRPAAPKRSRVVRSDRLEAAVRQLERMF